MSWNMSAMRRATVAMAQQAAAAVAVMMLLAGQVRCAATASAEPVEDAVAATASDAFAAVVTPSNRDCLPCALAHNYEKSLQRLPMQMPGVGNHAPALWTTVWLSDCRSEPHDAIKSCVLFGSEPRVMTGLTWYRAPAAGADARQPRWMPAAPVALTS